MRLIRSQTTEGEGRKAGSLFKCFVQQASLQELLHFPTELPHCCRGDTLAGAHFNSSAIPFESVAEHLHQQQWTNGFDPCLTVFSSSALLTFSSLLIKYLWRADSFKGFRDTSFLGTK